ncbi:putative beta-arrestin 1 [Schistosoma mansoni]|uniref:putative beta-arrestin 1 n=1 Tax=Schistosoma mansoni TaxID=6183 RepID=UPI0001A6453F|nr:putative beta-arrestin 1 [Schistosoma mansoni]|eukprot:XP_018647575.1 putative beta-arrestin 1 [Schistosoma mansoni]
MKDGVILISQDLKATEYVFLILTCSYRFGRDDLDVLGLTFQKELLIYTKCLWPNRSIIDNQLPLPPSISPSSVAIQTTQGSNNKPYGINYELTAFIGQRIDDNQPASSTVTIVLRKLTAGPKITQRPLQPIVESIKKTINLPCYYGELFIKASIEKPLYYHDESVCVSIVLDNLCQLPVRKLQVAIVQIAEVFVLTKGTYRSTVDKHFCKVNLPQAGEEQWKYTTILNTNLTDNILKRGVALDGYIRQEKNCSTDLVIKANKELHGIVISYCVRVRCWIGISRCSLYIPFLLMQPEKESEEGEEDNHVNCTNNHTLHVDIVQIHPSDLKVTNDELVEISNDNKSTV